MLLWYVIQTKPKKEKEAESYLMPKGVEILSPLLQTFSYVRGTMCEVVKPLFPNYIFGKFDLHVNYPLVRWARGVKSVLGFGGYPIPVAEEVIEVIKRRSGPDGIVKRSHRFEANDTVRVTTGPMKDLLGIFERYASDGERVRILLNLIGYQPAVEVHSSMIEKVA